MSAPVFGKAISYLLAALTEPVPGREERQTWSLGTPVPVVIVLRDFAKWLEKTKRGQRENPLLDFLFESLDRNTALKECAAALKRVIVGGEALVFLDGIDEIRQTAKERRALKAAVTAFCDACGDACRIVATSRPYAYEKQDWKLPGFQVAAIEPFDDDQIRAFVDKWYGELTVAREPAIADPEARAEALKAAIAQHDKIGKLAQRPLLLTFIAGLHAFRKGELPRERLTLYRELTPLLLMEWQKAKVGKKDGKPVEEEPSIAEALKVGQDDLLAALRTVAFQSHLKHGASGDTADIDEGTLLKALKDCCCHDGANCNLADLGVYLKDRAGLLCDRGAGAYAFVHRSFQEYLAAMHLTNICWGRDDKPFPDNIVELFVTDPVAGREPLLLAAANLKADGRVNLWSLVDALTSKAETNALCAVALGEIVEENELWKGNLESYQRIKIETAKTHLLHAMSGDLPPPSARTHVIEIEACAI